jgi:aspartate/methionine/tyrosine aminotransferase
MALLDRDDEVLVPAPFWVSYPEMVRYGDGVPCLIETEPENGVISAPYLCNRRILMNWFSKGYGLTGWRLGFAAASKPIIAAINALNSQGVRSPSTIAQYAALAALSGSLDFRDRNRR